MPDSGTAGPWFGEVRADASRLHAVQAPVRTFGAAFPVRRARLPWSPPRAGGRAAGLVCVRACPALRPQARCAAPGSHPARGGAARDALASRAFPHRARADRPARHRISVFRQLHLTSQLSSSPLPAVGGCGRRARRFLVSSGERAGRPTTDVHPENPHPSSTKQRPASSRDAGPGALPESPNRVIRNDGDHTFGLPFGDHPSRRNPRYSAHAEPSSLPPHSPLRIRAANPLLRA
jgi:hypothetical protein